MDDPIDMPDRRVLSYRADGCYSLGSSTLKPNEEVWCPLSAEPQAYRVEEDG